MNPIYQRYISDLGRRYASSTILNVSRHTCQLLDRTLTFAVTEFTFGNEKVRFFEHGNAGFISKNATCHSKILPSHKSIVQEIGVISDLYNFSDKYLQNITDAFLCHVPQEHSNILQENLEETCKENTLAFPVNSTVQLEDLTIFAYEANGNVFLYNAAGEVFLYANDHCYKNLIPVAGYPESTLYHLEDMPKFENFVKIFLNNF